MSISTAASPATLRVLALLAALIAAAAAADDGMTHLHLYIHETVAGANATAAAAFLSGSSPLGDTSSFGSIGAVDDELREGSDPASQYLGRAEGLLVQADLGSPAASCAILSLAFTEGDFSGSTLVVDGRVVVDLGGDGEAAVELAVVGGTGRFRRARGYSLMTKVGNPTPSTVVFEMDLYVKIGG